MRKRRAWKLHSLMGLLAGLPLLVIALSGSLLVFSDELEQMLIPEVVKAASSESPRLSLDVLRTRIDHELADYETVGWAFFEDTKRADMLYVIKRGGSEWEKTFIAPGSGAVQVQPQGSRDYLMGWVLELHYAFFAGHLGMLVTGLLALLLCALGISGFYIYRRFWRNFLLLRWSESRRIFLGDVHRRVGIVSAPIILILGITGAYWNLTHAVNDLWEHGLEHEDVPVNTRLYNPALSLDALLAEAKVRLPNFEVRYLSLPSEEKGSLVFYGEMPTRNFLRSPYGSRVSFDAQSGGMLEAQDIREAGLWEQFIDMFLPLHFGNFGGLPIKLLWCLVGLAPSILSFSGTYIWWCQRTQQKRSAAKLQAYNSNTEIQDIVRRVA